VTELEPLGLKHNPKCQCGGWNTCRQAAAAVVGRANTMALVEQELFAHPELVASLMPCRCDARYCSVSCSCLPGRVVEARERASGKMAASAAAAAVAAAAPVASKPFVSGCGTSTYDYKHHVDDCACGTCHKARVDSGTDDAYLEKCQRNTRLSLKRLSCAKCKETKQVTGRDICMDCYVERNSYDKENRLKMPSELDIIRKGYVLEEATYIATKKAHEAEAAGGGFGAALAKASAAISVAAAKSGGAEQPDFANNLFAAMGTPHDSKCPHGLPFYACMPCSH
jgi:hypothetical protein